MIYFALGYIAGTAFTVGLLFVGFCLGAKDEDEEALL